MFFKSLKNFGLAKSLEVTNAGQVMNGLHAVKYENSVNSNEIFDANYSISMAK